jgi:hypothetical protein
MEKSSRICEKDSLEDVKKSDLIRESKVALIKKNPPFLLGLINEISKVLERKKRLAVR